MSKVVVLDIEGTVCSIKFVKDVLYPFAMKKAQDLVPKAFPLDKPSAAEAQELVAPLEAFPAESKTSPEAILSHMAELTAKDIKAPYLKQLQGILWRSGYDSGELKCELFPDAAKAIPRWAEQLEKYGPGSGIYIYSSGSVAAQKLLFENTGQGDLTKYLQGYFDTVNAGPKTDEASYKKIEKEIGVNDITFFSDNPLEIDAARKAGWETVYTVRTGNAPKPADFKPSRVSGDFDVIDF